MGSFGGDCDVTFLVNKGYAFGFLLACLRIGVCTVESVLCRCSCDAGNQVSLLVVAVMLRFGDQVATGGPLGLFWCMSMAYSLCIDFW